MTECPERVDTRRIGWYIGPTRRSWFAGAGPQALVSSSQEGFALRTSKHIRRIAAATAVAASLTLTMTAADAGAQGKNCSNPGQGNSPACPSTTTTSSAKPKPTFTTDRPLQSYCRDGLVFNSYLGLCETDSDNDGLGDSYETLIGTDKFKRDTDGDRLGDGVEILLGYNPLDPNSPGSICNPKGNGNNCF